MDTTKRACVRVNYPEVIDPGSRGRRFYEAVRSPVAFLWFSVIVMAVFDIVSTYHGLRLGLIEHNPIAVAGLSLFGFWGLIGLKGIGIGVAAACWQLLDVNRYLVPSTFILIWGEAVLSNIVLLLAHF